MAAIRPHSAGRKLRQWERKCPARVSRSPSLSPLHAPHRLLPHYVLLLYRRTGGVDGGQVQPCSLVVLKSPEHVLLVNPTEPQFPPLCTGNTVRAERGEAGPYREGCLCVSYGCHCHCHPRRLQDPCLSRLRGKNHSERVHGRGSVHRGLEVTGR